MDLRLLASMTGLLLIIPSGAALLEPPAAVDASIPGERTTTDGPLAVTGDAPVDVAGTIESLTECRSAVRYTSTLWGGMVEETSQHEGDFLEQYSWIETITELLPIVEEVEVPLFDDVPLLGGTSLTRTVEQVVGYEEVSREVTQTADLAVSVEWLSEYVTWEKDTQEVYLTLPVGLPQVAKGDGVLVQVCGDQEILDFLPHHDMSQYDYVSIWEVHDGWFWSLLSTQVRLATAEESETLPILEEGISICPSDIITQAQDEVDRQLDENGIDDLPGGDEDEAATPDAIGLPAASTGGGSGGLIAASVSGLVGLLGAAGFVMRRFF